MFAKLLLVFSKRLTEKQQQQVERIIESADSVYVIDVKSHAIEIMDSRGQSEIVAAINKIAEAVGAKRIDNIGQEGYLYHLSGTTLQSEDMKQDLEEKARKLF